MSEKLYPLKLEPQLLEKVWGGTWLAENLGRKAKAGQKLGESWEAYSGSKILNGAWQGRTLGELYQEKGANLGGELTRQYPEFPLLVKFIDARENLSVQVHPDNALAQKLENYRFGKSEMWYIIAAEPEARILYSLNDKAQNLAEIGTVLQSQDESILDYLNSVPVKAGDVVYLPSRTIHALCEGIVVYELQQESDITYRLYDWGRQGREIHFEKGLQAISLEQRNLQISHPALTRQNGAARITLVDSPFFNCDLLEVADEWQAAGDKQSFTLLSAIENSGQILSPDNSFAAETIATGDTFFVPANLPYALKASNPKQALRVLLGQAR